MKRTFLTACLLLFGAGAARADEPEAKPVKVSFGMLKTQHMTVMVKINGEGPFRMIFDTGAPVTLLNNKTARAVGLIDKKAKGAMLPLFPGMGQFKLKTLEFGAVKTKDWTPGLTARDVPVIVMDHPTINLVAKHLGPIEGIVGFSFFARYRMTIDYQTKEMTFVPTGFQPGDMMARMMLVLTTSGKTERKILAPAGQWGFSVAKEKDDAEAGVHVKGVLAGSAAALAGLKVGDRLLTLDGRWTDTVTDTYRAAGRVRPGTAARVSIRRDGKEMELTVNVQSGL